MKAISRELNVGLLGYGYWGINLLKNIVANPFISNITVCDINENNLKAASSHYPQIVTTINAEEVFGNPDIHAVIIATPSSTHFELSRKSLLSGKHVLVEKPFVTEFEKGLELCQLAESMGLILMVDHVFMYHPVVTMLKELVQPNYLGAINYIDSTRINLGIYQDDTSVLWDLACHDISIVNYLINEKPESVRAIGRVHVVSGVEDIVYLFLHYKSGLIVQINTSWASPVKIRQMIIGGERKLIMYDDIQPTNKLVVYDYSSDTSATDRRKSLVDYRLGNISIPKYDLTEPLQKVVEAFVDSVSSGFQPLSNGWNALEVTRILIAAQKSLNSLGEVIHIP